MESNKLTQSELKGFANRINQLADIAHLNSSNKGFWDDYRHVAGSIVRGAIDPQECEAHKQYYDDQWFAKNMAEAMGELGEALEARRANAKPKVNIIEKYLEAVRSGGDQKINFEVYIKDSEGDEIADCIIRLLQFCSGMGIDIGNHIMLKMEYNSKREYKHGKKY